MAEIRKTYGEPYMNVTQLNGGHLSERCYYVSPDNSAMTVATVNDGFVSSVETLAKPNFVITARPSGN
jgi:hypothetical protein